MRQEHRAGEKLFVDYAGQTVPVIDRQTGEIRQTQIFVAVLGASSYTSAEAIRSMASAPAWASCAWANSTAKSGWKPLASVRWHWAHAATGASNRSCAKAWRSCRWPNKTCRCCPMNTSTCAALAITTGLKKEHEHAAQSDTRQAANPATARHDQGAYLRQPRLMEELGLAHGDGRFAKLMAGYAKTDLVVLDDWGLAPFTAVQRRDMLELLDDRYGNRSTLVTSQMPMDKWHALIGDPTLGDAILDRLAHNAYRIELKGESMRRRATKLTTAGTSD
jgi:hypothetical protein